MEPVQPTVQQVVPDTAVNMTEQIKKEVERVLQTFRRSMEAYYDRTRPGRVTKKISIESESALNLAPTHTAHPVSTNKSERVVDVYTELNLNFAPPLLSPTQLAATGIVDRFAMQAAAKQSRAEGTEKFVNTFEAFADEMRRNFAAQSQELKLLKVALARAEQEKLAMLKAHSKTTEAYNAEVAQLRKRQSEVTPKITRLERKVLLLENEAEKNKFILDNHTHRMTYRDGGPGAWNESHTGKRDISGRNHQRKDPTL
jgi:hypothetical protein